VTTSTLNLNAKIMGYYSINGYPVFSHKGEYVYLHRLTAVASEGFEAVVDSHVHHKDGITWRNTVDNLELMTHGEHARHHQIERGA